MQIKSITLVLVFFATLLNAAFSQELTIKSLTVAPMDLSASQYERKDLAGHPCGLVKVQLATMGVKFEGYVVGQVAYKTGEYWVYMENGSYMLTVKHPNFVPLDINFKDYGISGVSAKTTYKLTLLLPESSEKSSQQFIIRYSPVDAIVIIDSKPYQGNDGVVTASLPVGQHNYMVTASGYNPIEGSIRLKASAPSALRIDLEKNRNNTATSTPQYGVTNNSHQTKDDIETFTVFGVSFNMVRVEGGTFTMGATSEQGSDASDDEKPAYQVTLSDFSIGETEVTQALWQAVMGSNPSKLKGSNLPVETVSWDDCQIFIERLSHFAGRRFRLPTEAEWEYAARGGKKNCGYKYSGSDQVGDVAWLWENCGDKPLRGRFDPEKIIKHNCRAHDVKTKKGNELGLYDMSGNVWEWCQDWWGNYSSGSHTNPTGPSSGSYRVCRGGSWFFGSWYCRVSYRTHFTPDFRNDLLGLRIAL